MRASNGVTISFNSVIRPLVAFPPLAHQDASTVRARDQLLLALHPSRLAQSPGTCLNRAALAKARFPPARHTAGTTEETLRENSASIDVAIHFHGSETH